MDNVHLLDKITEILYRYDPVDIARITKKTDEYAGEAESILIYLEEQNPISEQQLYAAVYDVFVFYFGSLSLVGKPSSYLSLTREIWSEWKAQIR